MDAVRIFLTLAIIISTLIVKVRYDNIKFIDYLIKKREGIVIKDINSK
jgi:hypothetical protein